MPRKLRSHDYFSKLNDEVCTIGIGWHFLTKIDPGSSIFNRAGEERIIKISFVSSWQIFLVLVYRIRHYEKN